MAVFNLDLAKAPERRSFRNVPANDWAQIVESITGLLDSDVIKQAAFTAKVSASDLDSASTTVQRVIGTVASGTGSIVGSVLTFQFTPAETAKLVSANTFDIQIWVQRGSTTYVRTVIVGTVVAVPDITNTTTLALPGSTITIGGALPLTGAPGAEFQLSATVKDSGNNILSGVSVTWTSSNPLVASVDQTGYVRFWTNGACTITASSAVYAISAFVTATVSDPLYVAATAGMVPTLRNGVWTPENPNTRFTIAAPLVSPHMTSPVVDAGGLTVTAGGIVLTTGVVDTGSGNAVPSFTTRSAGTKFVMFSSIGAASGDYAVGVEAGAAWFSTPTAGQSFKWYGGTTLAASLSGAGALTLVSGVTAPSAVLSGAAATNRSLGFQTAGSQRWLLYANTGAESGADAGSDLNLQAYSDTGVGLGVVIGITRAAGGNMTISRPLTVSAAFAATAFATHTFGGVGTVGALNTTVQIGAQTTSGSAILIMRGAGSLIQWSNNDVSAWLQYTPGNDAHLYLRDVVNARMQVTYTPGATAAAALSQFGSRVTVDDVLKVAATGTLGGNPILDIQHTWNGAGQAFTALSVVATDTASASSSLLAVFKLSGSTMFSVRKDGLLTAAGGLIVSAGGATITAGGLTVSAGNVGIGMAPGTAVLSTTGATNVAAAVTFTNTNNSPAAKMIVQLVNDAGNAASINKNSSTATEAGALTFDSGANGIAIVFYHGGVERGRFAANGIFSTVNGITVGAGGLLVSAGGFDVTGNSTFRSPIILAGSPGGAGPTVRYIGMGGSTDMMYFNTPTTTGSYQWAVGEVQMMRLTSTGALVVANQLTITTGGLIVSAGTVQVPATTGLNVGTATFTQPATLGAAGTYLKTSQAGGLTLADSTSEKLTDATGLMLLIGNGNEIGLFWLLGHGNVVTLVNGNLVSTTLGNAGTVNVASNGVDSIVIENKRGAARVFRVYFFGA